MSDTGGIVTAQVDGWTVTSNSAKDEGALRASLKPKVEEALSKAGSELGKKGGEAAAKAKAESKDEEKPEKPTSEAKPSQADKAIAALKEQAEEKEAKEAKPAEEKPEAKAEPEKPKGEEKPLGPPRHDPRARMLEATRKEAEAKRYAAALEERARTLEARLAALERGEKPKEEPKPVQWDRSKKPVLEDFLEAHDTYEKGVNAYMDARDEWRDDQSRRHSQGEALERALDDQVKKFADAVRPHAEKLSGEVLSLKTAIQHALDSPGEPPEGRHWIGQYLFFNTETAPSLMLHFSEHPDELQRIAALQYEPAITRAMAKLEDRLEAAPTGDSPKPEPEVSKAAPPVKPVTGKPYVTEDGWRDGMSLDDYVRMRKRQQQRAQ